MENTVIQQQTPQIPQIPQTLLVHKVIAINIIVLMIQRDRIGAT